MMIIRRATKEDIRQLYDFNHRMYPARENYREIVDHWLSRADDAINDIVLCVDDEGKIRGQQLFCRMAYYYKGEKVDSTWAFDLIVDEELRAGSQGFALMWKCKKMHPNSLNSGCNDISLPISLKIGNSRLGNLRKYVGLVNPLYAAMSFFRKHENDFPEMVRSKGSEFLKISKEDLPDMTKPFNDSLLEIARDKDFLAWRFFSPLHKYAIYRLKDGNDYFAVRTIKKDHTTALVLVDYRCDLSTASQFGSIMLAFQQLARMMHIGIVIVGSSLATVDKVCEESGMRSVGRERPILGFLKCDDRKIDIDNRKFILWTLADSDGDTTW